MDFTCTKCGFCLSDYAAQLDLGAMYRSAFCPVCANKIVEAVSFPGVFYDEKELSYIIWNVRAQRTSEPIIETQKIGELEVSITGKSLNPYDICYKKVAVFQHEFDLVFPHHIVKPEYHRYLNPSAEIVSRLEMNKVLYTLSLHGKFIAEIRLPALVSKSEPNPETGKLSKISALNVWPNFRRLGWENYFFYFASNDPNVKLEYLRVLGPNDSTTTFEGGTARGEVKFVPSLIELKLSDMAGVEYWGCYRIDLKDDFARVNGEREDQIPILSLDFGTSNTCFAMKVSRSDDVEVVHFKDRTLKIIKGFSVEDSINLPWFPEVEVGADPPSQLPSELSFYRETESIAAEISSLQPIVHYTIPPFTRYRDDEEKMILGKLKWKNALPSTLSDSIYDLQHLYLSLAFRLALAELASDPRCQRLDKVDLIATCPLAFDSKQRTGFRNAISLVQQTIKDKISTDLILQKMYDESHAGEAGSGQMQGTKETIYIDVGGGTTDIGYFQFETDDSNENSTETPIYLDSFQYAGDDVWMALAESGVSLWKPTKFAREARAKGAIAIFGDSQFAPFKGQRNNADKGKKAIENFVDGLIEYTTRMIAARERARKEGDQGVKSLGLYLLGNGWRFLEVLHQHEGPKDIGSVIAENVKSLVEERLRKYKIDASPITVIYPFLAGKDPKTVVALGAALLYVGEKAGDIAAEPEFALQSFLGSDLKVFGPEHHIRWYEQLPYQLPKTVEVKGLNFVSPKEFVFEQPEVRGDLIEQTNLLGSGESILIGNAGAKYINKNMLAFYLEHWHKLLLVP